MKKILYGILIAVLVVIVAFAFYHKKYTEDVLQSQSQSANIKYATVGGMKLSVEVSNTLLAEAIGLGGRTSLAPNSTMLFAFDHPGKHDFWMKDMNFPIDMIWLDEGKRVIFIQKNVSPDTFPQSFGPSQNSMYVLEVVAGFSDKNNVQVGDSVSFDY